MNLTPELIEMFKGMLSDPKASNLPFRPLAECFVKTEQATPKDVLFKQYLEYLQRDLPKVVFYIIMDQLYGDLVAKAENGNLGYKLAFVPEDKYKCEGMPADDEKSWYWHDDSDSYFVSTPKEMEGDKLDCAYIGKATCEDESEAKALHDEIIERTKPSKP